MQALKKTNKTTLRSECRTVLKKSLTEPTLLEMSGNATYQASGITSELPVILPHSEASSKPRFGSNRGLRSREIQQHHIRELLPPFEDNFTSV
jgi:hypothetical protein